MKVLHIETGRHLYGGALQVRYLLDGLAARGVENILACPRGSEIAAAAGPFAEVAEVPMGGISTRDFFFIYPASSGAIAPISSMSTAAAARTSGVLLRLDCTG